MNYIKLKENMIVEEKEIDINEYNNPLNIEENNYLLENIEPLKELFFRKKETKGKTDKIPHLINTGKYALLLMRFNKEKTNCKEFKYLLGMGINDIYVLIKMLEYNSSRLPDTAINIIGGYFTFIFTSLLYNMEGNKVLISLESGVKDSKLKSKDCSFLKTKEGKEFSNAVLTMNDIVNKKFKNKKLTESVTISSLLYGLSSAAIKGAAVAVTTFAGTLSSIITSPITLTVVAIFTVRFIYINIAANLYWRLKDKLNKAKELMIDIDKEKKNVNEVINKADKLTQNKLKSISKQVDVKEKRTNQLDTPVSLI